MNAKSLSTTGQGPRWARRSLRRHMTMVIVLALTLVAGIGGWASTTELSSAVVSSGVLVVDDNVKKVQHLTGGIVSEIMVREGDQVQAGQKLLRLDGTTVKAELGIVESTMARLIARRERLNAELVGDATFDIDEEAMKLPEAAKFLEAERKQLANRASALVGMRSQLASRQSQLSEEVGGLTVQLVATEDALKLIVDELVGIEKLFKSGLVSMQRVSELKRQRADLEGRRGGLLASRAQAGGRMSEISLQILQLDEDRRAEIAKEQTETEAELAEMEQRRRSALDQIHRLDIISPVAGKALQVAVHTVNGVINPGETLMLIVPADQRLTVEAKVRPNDIDQLYVGQAVRVRFSALNHQTTPEIAGEVVTIAADIVIDKVTNQGYFPVRVYPDAKSVEKLGKVTLSPGMAAEVFIRTGDRSVMSYLMKPLTDQMQHAFREE